MDPLNSEMIANIAAQRLGPPPGGDPAAAGAAPDPAAAMAALQAQQQPPAKPTASKEPTSMEKAQSKLAPNDEGDASDAEAIRMIKLGDKEYTESQLNGTMSRYKDLNFRWQNEVAPMQPVMQVVKTLMDAAKQAGHEPDGKQMASLVDAAIKAYVKNPQMGNDGGQQPAKGTKGATPAQAGATLGDNDDDDDAILSQWEKENAVKLPPGFKDMSKANKAMTEKMNAMMEMVTQLVHGNTTTQQVVSQANDQMGQAQNMQAEAATNMIRNNLNQSFNQAQLPLDDASRADFRMFAAQRGYDFPDFMDPELTATVVADYKANKNAPEIERLRAIAQKRQAFTGMTEGAPGGAGGAVAAPADPQFAGMLQSAMQQRGMG